MAKRKSKNGSGALNAVLITIILVAAAFIVMLLSSYLIPPPNVMNISMLNETHDRTVAFSIRAAELDANMLLRIGLSITNALLVVYLLFIYVRDYLRLRSSFTLGIIAFLFSFLLYSISSIPFLHILLGLRGIGDALSFIPMVFSAIGLLVFAKLSNE